MEHTPHIEAVPYASTLEKRIVFFFVSVGIISITYGVFFLFDFLPEKPTADAVNTNETPVATEIDKEDAPKDVLPLSIIFDSLNNKVVKVLNPESATVEALDAALLTGVVRHPESADFLNPGTIFILGHSSYLPVVNNKNFQAFNGIQKLKWGDTIRLRSSDTEYVYSVERVYEASANDGEVEIEKGEARLILATCNSFATKDARFIVEAVLVESYAIAGEGA